MISRKRLGTLAVLATTLWAGGDLLADAATKVFLNGQAAPVHFNDGDSFRVLGGPLNRTKGRLAGFNTLESYGAVHQWGDWTTKELYNLAKMGTMNGRQGVWTCTSELDKDVYGRILWVCPDLVEDQLRKGLAHALTITTEPSPESYLVAQREAQEAKRGIWAHGIPEYVLTSTHSAAESFDKGKAPYNRLVSTQDGHSKRWIHNSTYDECTNVCYVPVTLDPELVLLAAHALKADSDFSEGLSEVSAEVLAAEITQYVDFSGLWTKDLIPKKLWKKLSFAIEAKRQAGELGAADEEGSSCMIYADFRRRFGVNRAKCL